MYEPSRRRLRALAGSLLAACASAPAAEECEYRTDVDECWIYGVETEPLSSGQYLVWVMAGNGFDEAAVSIETDAQNVDVMTAYYEAHPDFACEWTYLARGACGPSHLELVGLTEPPASPP